MANYKKISISNEPRVELHDALELTGAEISVNTLPAGAGIPFVHAHKNNEEIYWIVEGKGSVVVDGETIELTAGDWLRLDPPAKRQFSAAPDSHIKYICVQVKANSLGAFTKEDALV